MSEVPYLLVTYDNVRSVPEIRGITTDSFVLPVTDNVRTSPVSASSNTSDRSSIVSEAFSSIVTLAMGLSRNGGSGTELTVRINVSVTEAPSESVARTVMKAEPFPSGAYTSFNSSSTTLGVTSSGCVLPAIENARSVPSSMSSNTPDKPSQVSAASSSMVMLAMGLATNGRSLAFVTLTVNTLFV